MERHLVCRPTVVCRGVAERRFVTNSAIPLSHDDPRVLPHRRARRTASGPLGKGPRSEPAPRPRAARQLSTLQRPGARPCASETGLHEPVVPINVCPLRHQVITVGRLTSAVQPRETLERRASPMVLWGTNHSFRLAGTLVAYAAHKRPGLLARTAVGAIRSRFPRAGADPDRPATGGPVSLRARSWPLGDYEN